MKNSVITVLVALCLFVYCKKPHDPDDPHNPGNGKKYPVCFTVKDFDQHMENFGKTTADTLSDYIDYLYYVVYPDGAPVLRKIVQTSADENFGIIYDSLPAGSYVIALVGSKDPVTLGYYHRDTTPNLLIMNFPGTDVFYKRMLLNVNGAVNQVVSLDRIVAKLKVIIRDRIPYDANAIGAGPAVFPPIPGDVPQGLPRAFDLRSGERLLHGGPGDALLYSSIYHEFSPEEKGMQNFSMEDYILMPVADTITVNIQSSGIQTFSKTIYQVSMTPGKRTVLSGNLFDTLGTSDNGVNVIINNPEWSPDSTLQNF